MSFSYYDKAIDLNPSAVDAVYRMHASRLKLLCTRGKQNKEVLKVVAEYSFSESTKENVMKILSRMGTEIPDLLMDVEDKSIQTNPEDTKLVDSHQLEKAWHMLYRDCLSALEICVEGDLKHFRKAIWRGQRMNFPFALSHLAHLSQLICGRLIVWSRKEGAKHQVFLGTERSLKFTYQKALANLSLAFGSTFCFIGNCWRRRETSVHLTGLTSLFEQIRVPLVP